MDKNEIVKLILSGEYGLLREERFKKTFPKIYGDFKKWEHTKEEMLGWKFKQKLWHFLQDDFELDLGKCCECGERSKLVRFSVGYKKFCSVKCANKNQIHNDKIKQTCREKYGDEKYNNRELCKQTKQERYGDVKYNNRDKARETCVEIYGYEYYSQTDEYKNRIKQTCLDKYGVDNPNKCEKIRKKSEQTCLKKYGNIIYTKSQEYQNKYYDEVLPKYQQTCTDRYGVNNYAQTEEWRIKNYQTKKKNKSLGTSVLEDNVYKWLIDNNINVIRQYMSELYPFTCDFYLPDYDLYIEIQGYWTHGLHPFDKNNEDDLKIIDRWKTKNTPQYIKGIENWTIKDVLKRETARTNKINFLEVFSCDLDLCIKKIKERIF